MQKDRTLEFKYRMLGRLVSAHNEVFRSLSLTCCIEFLTAFLSLASKVSAFLFFILPVYSSLTFLSLYFYCYYTQNDCFFSSFSTYQILTHPSDSAQKLPPHMLVLMSQRIYLHLPFPVPQCFFHFIFNVLRVQEGHLITFMLSVLCKSHHNVLDIYIGAQ